MYRRRFQKNRDDHDNGQNVEVFTPLVSIHQQQQQQRKGEARPRFGQSSGDTAGHALDRARSHIRDQRTRSRSPHRSSNENGRSNHFPAYGERPAYNHQRPRPHFESRRTQSPSSYGFSRENHHYGGRPSFNQQRPRTPVNNYQNLRNASSPQPSSTNRHSNQFQPYGQRPAYHHQRLRSHDNNYQNFPNASPPQPSPTNQVQPPEERPTFNQQPVRDVPPPPPTANRIRPADTRARSLAASSGNYHCAQIPSIGSMAVVLYAHHAAGEHASYIPNFLTDEYPLAQIQNDNGGQIISHLVTKLRKY